MTLENVLSDVALQRYLAVPLAPGQTLVAVVVLLLLLLSMYFYLRGLYRLHLHPLSVFPGPVEAAKSHQWLFRQAKGRYPERTFEKLHKKYQAKAIRIAPNELHIDDTDLYKVIYKQSKPFPKHETFYMGFSVSAPTMFTEVDASKHKERRRLLSPMFSRAGVLKLENLIRESVKLLENKIDRLHEKGNIDFHGAFRLITTRIIMEFSFADSGDVMDEQPHQFGSRFLSALSVALHGTLFLQRFPWIRAITSILPESLLEVFNPQLGNLFGLVRYAEAAVNRWRISSKEDKAAEHPIVLNNLTDVPDSVKVAEAIELLVAGSDTTATTLTVGLLEILSHPKIEERLIMELDAAIPDRDQLPPVQSLEKIDYLNACVKEAIRFASAVPGRLPRVVPYDNPEPFVVDGHVVPPGTTVSMSAHTMHSSTEIWGPDARSFNPDRWLTPDAKNLEQYQVSFSKGARMCIGQNLVPVEIAIILASIFRKYKLSFPPGFIPPERNDVFTLELDGGLSLKVSRRV